MQLLSWALAMAVFWLLLSGFFLPLLLIFGVISVALVVAMVAKMNQVDKEVHSAFIGPKLVMYCVWLVAEVIKSSLEVARLVWRTPAAIKPAVGFIPLNDATRRSRVLYANSITLTPGTLTVDVDDEEITVHALDSDSIEALHEGDMERRITRAGEP